MQLENTDMSLFISCFGGSGGTGWSQCQVTEGLGSGGGPSCCSGSQPGADHEPFSLS